MIIDTHEHCFNGNEELVFRYLEMNPNTYFGIGGGWLHIRKSEAWGKLTPHSNGFEESFLYYFLPLENLEESIDRNPVAAIQVFPKDQAAIVVTCGTKDWLYPRNLEFIKKSENSQILSAQD